MGLDDRNRLSIKELSINDFARIAGYEPDTRIDQPRSHHRHFIRVCDGYICLLFVQRLAYTGTTSTRITLSVYPTVEGGEVESGARPYTYDFSLSFEDELGSLSEKGELDSKKLKGGGYEKVAQILRRLEESGELKAAAEWQRLMCENPIEFSSQSVEAWEHILHKLHDYVPRPVEDKQATRADCENGDPKWECHIIVDGEHTIQLLIERLVHSSGARLRVRMLDDDEDPGSLKEGHNLGKYIYSATGDLNGLFDETGRFPVELLNGWRTNILGRTLDDILERGWLETLHRAREVKERYDKNPMLYKEEVLDPGKNPLQKP